MNKKGVNAKGCRKMFYDSLLRILLDFAEVRVNGPFRVFRPAYD